MNLNLENINLGTTTGDKTGDGAKTGGGKINRNFAKIKAFLETPDAILIQTGYNLAGQNLTFLAGWEWRIEAVVYTNPSNVVVNFRFASSGKQRIDLIVATSSNTFLRVPGVESINNPVAPLVPEGTLLVVSVDVFDDVISLIKKSVYMPIGGLQIFKAPGNTNDEKPEGGDMCVGFVEGQFITAPYLGGNLQLLASFDI